MFIRRTGHNRSETSHDWQAQGRQNRPVHLWRRQNDSPATVTGLSFSWRTETGFFLSSPVPTYDRLSGDLDSLGQTAAFFRGVHADAWKCSKKKKKKKTSGISSRQLQPSKHTCWRPARGTTLRIVRLSTVYLHWRQWCQLLIIPRHGRSTRVDI